MILAILSLFLFGITSIAQVVYFPKNAFSGNLRDDRFVSDWYSRNLMALKEPSLFEKQKTLTNVSYRFVWLRTFHHPVAIRLDLKADGTGILTTKVASGAGGYNPGVLTVNNSRLLTPEEIHHVLGKIKTRTFGHFPLGNKIEMEQTAPNGSSKAPGKTNTTS